MESTYKMAKTMPNTQKRNYKEGKAAKKTVAILLTGVIFPICCLLSCSKEEPKTAPNIQSTKQGQFKKGTEPGGFRGIKWGTRRSVLQDRGLDKKYIAGVQMVGDGYDFLFYNGKFGGIEGGIYNAEDFLILKRFLFLKFGPTAGESIDTPDFWEESFCYWKGSTTVIILFPSTSSRARIFYMADRKLHEVVEARKRERQRQQESEEQKRVRDMERLYKKES